MGKRKGEGWGRDEEGWHMCGGELGGQIALVQVVFFYPKKEGEKKMGGEK